MIVKDWLMANAMKLLLVVIAVLVGLCIVFAFQKMGLKVQLKGKDVDIAGYVTELDKAQRDYAQAKSNRESLEHQLAVCSAQLDVIAVNCKIKDETSGKKADTVVARKPTVQNVGGVTAPEMNAWLASLFPSS